MYGNSLVKETKVMISLALYLGLQAHQVKIALFQVALFEVALFQVALFQVALFQVALF